MNYQRVDNMQMRPQPVDHLDAQQLTLRPDARVFTNGEEIFADPDGVFRGAFVPWQQAGDVAPPPAAPVAAPKREPAAPGQAVAEPASALESALKDRIKGAQGMTPQEVAAGLDDRIQLEAEKRGLSYPETLAVLQRENPDLLRGYLRMQTGRGKGGEFREILHAFIQSRATRDRVNYKDAFETMRQRSPQLFETGR